MKKSIAKPELTIHTGDKLPIPGDILVDLLSEVLSRNASFHLRAKGTSMTPFIHDGDFITISPLGKIKPNIGRIVAYKQPDSQNLVVHRIISLFGDSFLVQGDNANTRSTERINNAQILGYVTQVQRDYKPLRFGLGIERYLIAYLSKRGLLTRICRRLRCDNYIPK